MTTRDVEKIMQMVSVLLILVFFILIEHYQDNPVRKPDDKPMLVEKTICTQKNPGWSVRGDKVKCFKINANVTRDYFGIDPLIIK